MSKCTLMDCFRGGNVNALRSQSQTSYCIKLNLGSRCCKPIAGFFLHFSLIFLVRDGSVT